MKNHQTINRTSEDVKKELQEAEIQKNLWQKRARALKREAEVLEPKVAEEVATEVTEEVTEISNEEVEVIEEVAEVVEEISDEEVADEAEDAEEISDEEVADEAEDAEEISDEEVADEAEDAEEISDEEVADEAEDAEEISDEEVADEAEDAEEISDEEETDEAEDAEEISDEEETDEAEDAEQISDQDDSDNLKVTSKDKKGVSFAMAIACIAALIAVIAMLCTRCNHEPAVNPDNNGNIVDSGDNGDGDTVVDPAFDMDAFINSVVNIADTLTTDEDIAANADIFIEKIGANKLEELVDKYGELPVQKAIAEFLAFVPEIKMNQYISNNGLAYNPNATDDYYQMLDDADKAYTDATGKNPNGALMSLEGYDTYKSNREAMKALIIETGDMALLTWYEAKTNGYDAMVQQNADTETANAYKEEVKLELVNNVNGSVKLIELQLEQNVSGTDNNTLKYTNVYAEFIINNYMYVVAN